MLFAPPTEKHSNAQKSWIMVRNVQTGDFAGALLMIGDELHISIPHQLDLFQ